MLIKWAPEGGERREYPFQPNKVYSDEAESVEAVTGWSWVEFQEHFMKGSMLARRAALWIMRRRDEPDLKFHQVRFLLGEVAVDFTDDEKQAMWEWLNANPDADDDSKETIRSIVGADLLERFEADAGKADEAPKAEAAARPRTRKTA